MSNDLVLVKFIQNKGNKGLRALVLGAYISKTDLFVQTCRLEQAFFAPCASNYLVEWNINFVGGSVKKQEGRKMGRRSTKENEYWLAYAIILNERT